MMRFRDRAEAGKMLAESLMHYRDKPNLLILALPRGGVPVAYEVAQFLKAPLDVFIVRKLGAPGNPELAIGAIASKEQVFLNQGLIYQLGVSEQELAAIKQNEQEELTRRERLYRGDKPPLAIADKIIILIDDGIATGASMLTAIHAIKNKKPLRLVVAVPVAPLDTCLQLKKEVDEFVCLQTPVSFYSVGTWYEDFTQTTDEEVKLLLEVANEN